MTRILALIILALLLTNCSSSKLVDEYLNTESPGFRAKKVLVVGLAPDGGLQRQFEYSLVKALGDQNVLAIKSVDFFQGEGNYQTEEALANLERELIKAGFDAVLFSKLIGLENKVSLAQAYRNLSKSFESFSDYYTENRLISQSQQMEDYPIYNTETSLYCLCPQNKQDLIWRGKIDIVDPPQPATTIRDYVTTLLKTLKRNNLLIPK